MYKKVKLDFEKLKEGMEVFSIMDGWIKVTKIDVEDFRFPIKANDLSFTKKGKDSPCDRISTLVAMKVRKTVDEITTKKFVSGEKNYCVTTYSNCKWIVETYTNSEILGAKYYTKENAEVVAKILNKGENNE